VSELAATLATALATIPEERRRAILLYDVDGYDYAEIAELTGVSVGTIKSRISRGREELRRLLADLRPGTASPSTSLGERDE
jgi:RNA polymerase sigma-70 factor (ECF subfamily)